MSFILDALKKSESERQPQSAAEFTAATPAPAATTIPRWLWLVGALLLINLAVLIGLLLQSDDASPTAATSTAAISSPTETTTSGDDFAERVEEARRNPPSTQAIRTAPGVSQPDTSRPEDNIQPTLISQQPESVDLAKQYPTIHEMRVNGISSIPDLHLDIHVFSEVPADRFVFINMSKHREGSTLGEGPAVVEITPQGVVLDHSGRRFLLPRE